MNIELSESQLRWLGGLLRSFCSDEIYELEGDALEERFLHLLDCEMRSDRVDAEIHSPRAELQIWNEVFAEREAAEKQHQSCAELLNNPVFQNAVDEMLEREHKAEQKEKDSEQK